MREWIAGEIPEYRQTRQETARCNVCEQAIRYLAGEIGSLIRRRQNLIEQRDRWLRQVLEERDSTPG